jgi:Uri superfamily endonuclease
MGITATSSIARTYQLLIHVEEPLDLQVGRLGNFPFPAGYYIYTGSAKKNLRSRVQRHLSREKKLRWHIDYLLVSNGVSVVDVKLGNQEECSLNQGTGGRITAPGFGSSDCRQHCGSHLKYLGKTIKPSDEKDNN